MKTEIDAESAALLQEALRRSASTRFELHGELVSELGMSEDEAGVRLRDVTWRHGGRERAEAAAELNVKEGRWTTARAEEHVRRLELAAQEARALVVRCDEERAKRGTTASPR